MTLKNVSLTNYKCFRSDSYEMAPLTLLTGNNATGKSSFLQALLLARHSAVNLSNFVPLNNLFGLKLGYAADIRSFDADSDSIAIEIDDQNDTFRWEFASEGDAFDSLLLEIKVRPDMPESAPHLFAPRFTYLNAERLGPRETLDLSSLAKGSQTVGVRGEYVAQVLANQERDNIREAMQFKGTAPGRKTIIATTLLKQAEAWLSDFVGPVEIRPEIHPDTNRAYLRFKTNDPHSSSLPEWVRPSNTGFGLTYCLPVLVAGLLSKPGEIMIVENPEAHLHPRAQSKMGRFLGRLVASGVQVIVESHSDHILNGIRLGVVEDVHPLKAQDVLIYFFGDKDVTKVTVDARGSLSEWPDFFFDQSQRDLRAIVGTRGRRKLP